MASRVASRFLSAANLCVVCGKPGEVLRFTVRGSDGTPLGGRIFVKGSVICPAHEEMLEGV